MAAAATAPAQPILNRPRQFLSELHHVSERNGKLKSNQREPGSSGDLHNLLKMLDDPLRKDRMAKAGIIVAPLARAQFAKMYVDDVARWKQVMPAAGIKLE